MAGSKAPDPKYTSSPLGLIESFNEFNYQSNNASVNSIFTSYENSKGVKHRLKSANGSNAAVLSNTPHSNEIYDVSTRNIIENLKSKNSPHLELNFADFAYLKDFGVYPNNRAIIARRFAGPVVDDLYSIDSTKSPGYPLSTLIGYFGDSEDILTISFNEEWESSEVSFKELLNDLGKDFGMSEQFELGTILEKGLNAVPMPGATLLFQRKIMAALGLFGENVGFDEDSGEFRKYTEDKEGNVKYGESVQAAVIPQGDPNLIKESMVRSLVKEDSKGSGLSCKINITLKTKYEQKFIKGVDPSIVFMDILNNALNMGTSPANFYLGKQSDAEGRVTKFFEELTKNPGKKILDFINALLATFKKALNDLDSAMKSAAKKSKDEDGGSSNIAEDITNLVKESISKVKQYVIDFIREKYKIRFMGVLTALTGAPSTPWHITLGNPMRPIFCSGDMLCTGVDLNFGPQLSFNDLPTYIEVTAKYQSARNIGLQEIFAKFNTGGIRVTEGTLKGEYIAGISDSFWSFQQAAATQSTDKATGEESQSTDQTNKTDNTPSINDSNDNTSKVTPTTDTTSITPSVESDKSISADPQSTDKVIQAGGTSNVDAQRVDNSVDTTGSTEGAVDQVQGVDDKPYTGEDAKPNQTEEKGSTKKPKYTYTIKTFGPNKYVEATDESGKVVYSGQPSFSATEDVLLQEAKIALNDN